jgi:hypothetical protein
MNTVIAPNTGLGMPTNPAGGSRIAPPAARAR